MASPAGTITPVSSLCGSETPTALSPGFEGGFIPISPSGDGGFLSSRTTPAVINDHIRWQHPDTPQKHYFICLVILCHILMHSEQLGTKYVFAFLKYGLLQEIWLCVPSKSNFRNVYSSQWTQPFLHLILFFKLVWMVFNKPLTARCQYKLKLRKLVWKSMQAQSTTLLSLKQCTQLTDDQTDLSNSELISLMWLPDLSGMHYFWINPYARYSSSVAKKNSLKLSLAIYGGFKFVIKVIESKHQILIYIFTPLWCRLKIFHTINPVRSNNIRLKNLRFTPTGHKGIEISKFEFVRLNYFHSFLSSAGKFWLILTWCTPLPPINY